MRGANVFIDQNIIIHYKYLHNNIRTVFKFLDQSIYAFFCPAPPRGFSPSPRPADFCPRPAPLEKAPPRTSLVQGPQNPNLQLWMGHYSLVGEAPHTRATSNTGAAGQAAVRTNIGVSLSLGWFGSPHSSRVHHCTGPKCIDPKLPRVLDHDYCLCPCMLYFA